MVDSPLFTIQKKSSRCQGREKDPGLATSNTFSLGFSVPLSVAAALRVPLPWARPCVGLPALPTRATEVEVESCFSW